VIAAGIGDDSTAAFFVGQGCDLVIRSAQLEGADRLKVFQLEEELACIGGARPFEQGSASGDAAEESGGERLLSGFQPG
jgi:hypothetical protein